MNTKSIYNFKEAELDPDFARDKVRQFEELIDASLSFVVLSMPGVGVSYFLRYLAMQDFAYFVHVDLYSLPTLTQHEFYRMFFRDLGGKPSSATDEQVFLESKAILKKLAERYDKIVIIFSRFDQLKKDLDENFFSNLQSLTTLAPGKIVLIFTSIKPLHELAPEAVSGGNLNFYSKNLYFTPYSSEDLKKILTIEPGRFTSKENLEKLIDLSGGHNQLLHILLSSQKQQNLLLDQFVKLQLKELTEYLNYHQRKTLQKMTSAASHPERAKPFGSEPQGRRRVEGSIDEYLLGVGLVKKSDSGYTIFTPLLSEYIKNNLPVKLPVKEAELFKLLRKNMGNVVSKDEIFQEVWAENPDSATDWALDALIYRLRKHPFMKANGYIIESQKKVGYTLIQT